MSLSVPKILFTLGLVGAVFLFFSDDESVAPKTVKHKEHITKPTVVKSPQPQQFRPRGERYSGTPAVTQNYFNEFAQSPGAGQHWESRFPESHFRPHDQNNNIVGGYQADTRQPQPDHPAFSYGPPSYGYPDYRNQGGQPPPNAMIERFRPLDEKRQQKRWHGNYHPMSTWPEQMVAPDRSASYLRLAVQD